MNNKITLSRAAIAKCSEDLTAELTEKYGCEPKEAKRIALTAEEILLTIRDQFGEEKSAEIVLKKLLGKVSLRISFSGETYDPRLIDGEINDLLTMYSLIPDYIYKNGKNTVTIPVGTKKKTGFGGIVTAILISIALILITEFIPQIPARDFLSAISTPLFDTIIGFISAISGPIIFLSVLSGILAIGDISTLKSAGLRIIRDTLVLVTATVVISFLATSLFYTVTGTASDSSSADGSSVAEMVLDIIPDNFIQPFVTGNSMQIILIAVITGAALLALSSKIRVLADFIFELQSVVQQIMTWVNSIMPLLVCVTILNIYFSGTAGSVLKSAGAVGANAIVFVLITLFVVAFIAVRYKASFISVFKKLLPTMIISITTNSSSAAYLTNTETCRKKLGIEDSIVNFGVPFGQVISKSGIASIMACVSFCLASYYSVNMTPAWLITATLGTVMISIAVPPIPGGGLAAYTVLFGLLGIPAEGLAVAIPIEMIMEYPATAVDLSTVQFILIRTADKLKKLDLAVLRNKD